MTFVIRDLVKYDEMLAVHRLQQEIWGIETPYFGIYPPLMNTAAKNGGLVLGAFDAATGKLIAFLFGFLGREGNGPYKHCSQVMGVLAAWRGLGIGEALKAAQRQRVLSQGLSLITWTFDPLEGPNAQLNLHKLRAVSRRYWRDVYGSDFGARNAGLPTDRLLVEWWVRSEWVDRPAGIDRSEAVPIFDLSRTDAVPRIQTARLALTAEYLLLDIPADLTALKAADIDLALDWRVQARAAFETYFAAGYITTDFVSEIDPATGGRQNRYLLQKTNPALLAGIGIDA